MDRRERPRKAPSDDVCWGRNTLIALLEDAPSRCTKVFISRSMGGSIYDRITSLCRSNGIPFVMADAKALDEMTGGGKHQGAAAITSPADLRSLDEAADILPPQPEPALALLFDHVQDPQNLGAMIRSAEAAGASFAALTLRRGALPGGTVAKTSAGASIRLPLIGIGNSASAVRELQGMGLWCVGLEASGARTIYEAELPPRVLLVIGSEGGGLTRTTAEACDEVLRIPMKGGAGSLSASAAAAVASFEWVRSRLTV